MAFNNSNYIYQPQYTWASAGVNTVIYPVTFQQDVPALPAPSAPKAAPSEIDWLRGRVREITDLVAA